MWQHKQDLRLVTTSSVHSNKSAKKVTNRQKQRKARIQIRFTLYFLGAKESHFVYRPVKALKTGSRKCLYLIFYRAYSIRVPFRKNGPSIFRLESQLTERLAGANPITLSPYNMGATWAITFQMAPLKSSKFSFMGEALSVYFSGVIPPEVPVPDSKRYKWKEPLRSTEPPALLLGGKRRAKESSSTTG